MFVIGQSKITSRTIEVELPAAPGDEPIKASFVVLIKRQGQDVMSKRLAEMRAQSKAMSEAIAAGTPLPEVENFDDKYLGEDIVEFQGIQDESGNEAGSTPETIKAVLDDRIVRAALINAINDVNFSPVQAQQRKN